MATTWTRASTSWVYYPTLTRTTAAGFIERVTVGDGDEVYRVWETTNDGG
jgi:hypothetical protein